MRSSQGTFCAHNIVANLNYQGQFPKFLRDKNNSFSKRLPATVTEHPLIPVCINVKPASTANTVVAMY